jgi:hypothetical protein
MNLEVVEMAREEEKYLIDKIKSILKSYAWIE